MGDALTECMPVTAPLGAGHVDWRDRTQPLGPMGTVPCSVRDVKERRLRPQGRGRGTDLTETESGETASARDRGEGNGPGILPRARPDPASQADVLLKRQRGKTLPSLSGVGL